LKKITVSVLSVFLMLSMVFSSSVFAAEKTNTSALNSFLGLFSNGAKVTDTANEVGVTYRTHIQNQGWEQTWASNGQESGTDGLGLRLEAIEVKLADAPAGLGIEYRTHIQNQGWEKMWASNGEESGTDGLGLRLEAIEIRLTGDNASDYSVQYRTHIQNQGWEETWAADGEESGTDGLGLRLEAIEIKIVQKEADLTAYNAALAAVKEADYTPASWTKYQAVVAANVVTKDNTISKVAEATAAITAAQASLVKIANISSVVATSATTVEVTFPEALTEVKASEFSIDGLTVSNAVIKQTDNKVAVLTTSAQVGAQVYKLSYQGVDSGLTFTGISAVVPTAIKIADGTNFTTVGENFTLKATVTTANPNKAGIPVTFNIKAPAGSLNDNIAVERYTDANGVAEYTYTRYATADDLVAVYPSGAASIRDTRTISWSAQPLLSVATSDTNVIANGGTKTYTVTERDQTTGNPVGAGRTIKVLFNENIGTINNTSASATDVSNATTVVPFQRATGAATTLNLTTNANGTVTFTVTGSNTTATPIIFIDSNWDNRLDSGDLQLVQTAVTFQGAQVTNQITVTPDSQATIAASANRGRVYTVEVKKPDGTAFAGGVVQVAFNELIDNNLGTTTNAQFIWYDNDNSLRTTASNGVVAGVQAPNVPAGFPRQMAIQLNNDGKATFMIANATQAQVATPIVWIDQDSTTANTNHVLEATEPNDLGGVTVTEGQTVTSASLGINQESQGVGTNAVVTYTTLDQNGAAYIGGVLVDGGVRTTYTIANTGANVLTVSRNIAADNTDAGTWSVNGASNAAYAAGAPLTTINPGMSATIAVTQTAGQNNSNLVVTAADPTTYTVSAQGLTTASNKSLAAAAVTGAFVNEVNVDDISTTNGTFVSGTITAFDTADAVYDSGLAQSGRIKISVDGQPGQYAWFTYNAGLNGGVISGQANDSLFVGNDSSFNANTPATNAQFESALSVGNKVRITVTNTGIPNLGHNHLEANNISLYNANATNNTSQINQTLPVVAPPAPTAVVSNVTTVAGGTTGVAQANGTAAFDINGGVGNLVVTKPNSDALNGVNFIVQISNGDDNMTVTRVGNDVTIKLADTTAAKNAAGLITTAVNNLGGDFANVTVAGAGTGVVPVTVGSSPKAITGGVTAVAAVRADHNFTLLQQLAVGETITVNYGATVVTLTAGTDFGVGADVNTQAANIATALDTALNAANVTVSNPGAPSGTIRLYQDATFEAPVAVTVTTNPAAK